MTDGDYHVYRYASPASVQRLAQAGGLALSPERDPVSGPLEAAG